jgi:hypothetical protein
LKNPPTFTCPVIRVVADSRMVERIPLRIPSSSTSNAVTPTMAPPSSNVRRLWVMRFRTAIRKS